MQIHFTLFRSDSPIGKQARLSPDGLNVDKTDTRTSPQTASHATASSADELAALLANLDKHTALGAGQAPVPEARLITLEQQKASTALPSDTFTRSLQHFKFPSAPGLLVLDFDGDHATTPPSLDSWKTLAHHHPALYAQQMVQVTSSSSFLYSGEIQLSGLRGQHIYIPVLDATDISRAGKALFARLWLTDPPSNHFIVGKRGSKLARGLVDAAVWSPERFFFSAGMTCAAPLVQRRPLPLILNPGGEWLLDTRKHIPDLTSAEVKLVEKAVAKAKKAVEKRSEELKKVFISTHSEKIKVAAQTVRNAIENGTLPPEWELHCEDGSTTTVGALILLGDKALGLRFADPLEPEYGSNDRRIAVCQTCDSRPGAIRIFSHAHGGINYSVPGSGSNSLGSPATKPGAISLSRAGELASSGTIVCNAPVGVIADRVCRAFKAKDLVFETAAGTLVCIGELDERLVEAPLAKVQRKAEALEWYTRPKKAAEGEGEDEDSAPLSKAVLEVECLSKAGKVYKAAFELSPPHNAALTQLVGGMEGDRDLNKLDAVWQTPILRLDGTLLSKPGYDKQTQGWVCKAPNFPLIPEAPTKEQALEALDALFAPFVEFEFESDADEAAHLAALLSACVARICPTRPAAAYNAAEIGSGKSYLAECLAILASGSAKLDDAPKDPEEWKKDLLAQLVDAHPCVIYDNIKVAVSSEAFASVLTSAKYSGRILGATRTAEVVNRTQFVLTGNNLVVDPDISRRLLWCKVVKQPTRIFTFDPRRVTAARRFEMLAAGMTVVRAWIAAGRPTQGRPFDSFSEWDSLVRQPVIWLTGCDPLQNTLDLDKYRPRETDELSDLLRTWYDTWSSQPMKTKDVIRYTQTRSDDELHAAVGTSRCWHPGKKGSEAQTLGIYLHSVADRPADGLVLRETRDNHAKVKLFHVELAGERRQAKRTTAS